MLLENELLRLTGLDVLRVADKRRGGGRSRRETYRSIIERERRTREGRKPWRRKAGGDSSRDWGRNVHNVVGGRWKTTLCRILFNCNLLAIRKIKNRRLMLSD